MKYAFSKILTAALVLGFSTAAVHAAPEKKLSKIYAYKGSYSGTLVIGGASSGTGATTGNFTASKKKDTGTLSLTSVVSVMGSSTAVLETFNINNHALTYFLSAGTGGGGAGTVTVGKKTISYSAAFSIMGNPYLVSGTMRLNKKALAIQETITGQGETLVFSYQLKRRGK